MITNAHDEKRHSRRVRRTKLLYWAVVAALLLLTPSLWILGDNRAEIQGRWLIDFERDDAIQLTLQRRSDGHQSWNSSSGFSLRDFQGLRRPAGAADVPVRFEMLRDAGTISFEGQLNESGGGGRFRFAPNPEYVAALTKTGYGSPDADLLFSLAVHDVSRAFMRELEGLGYKHSPLDDLLSMRIHGAGPEFIRELKSLGYEGLSADDLVSMRIHGATAEFIRQMKSLGYDHLSPDDLVSMRIHGASPEFVRDLRSLGYTNLSADDLVSMRIHGVSPEFIRGLQELGYRNVSAEDLVSMRIHGVSIDYVKKMKARFRNVSVDELVEMRIHGRN
ncbi:MAG TPA: hypothetical protein VGL03_08635 [Thermoanaerobaculia bacterium]